jgi:hypothetical protein
VRKQDVGALFCLVTLLAVTIVANRHLFFPRVQASQMPRTLAASPPVQFPPDFPIYPRAVYVGTEAGGQTNGRSYDRGWFAVREDGNRVAVWYADQLVQTGYSPVLTSETPRVRQYSFAADKNVVRVEIFVETDRPTTFSVDFYSPPN